LFGRVTYSWCVLVAFQVFFGLLCSKRVGTVGPCQNKSKNPRKATGEILSNFFAALSQHKYPTVLEYRQCKAQFLIGVFR
jgi:hypothetical protein